MTFLRMSHLAVALLALSTACSGGKDDTTDDTDTTETVDTTPSEATLKTFFPENGATDVFYQTPIEIVFGQDETTTATITLKTGGTEVSGTTTFSADGETANFKPDEPLMPSTTYEVSVTFSGDKSASATWTTSDTGAPVDASTLIGKVYNVDIFGGRITEPAGIGELLPSLLGDTEVIVLLSPSEVNGSEITMRGALGTTNGGGAVVQDVCSESINFPVAADYSADPYFTISGTDVPLSVQGIDLVIDQLDVGGAFSPNGDAIEGASLNIFLDTRPLASLGLGDICQLAGLAGAQCIACGDGEVACLRVVADSLSAPVVPGLDGIAPISAADVEANADCAEAPAP